MSKTFEEMEGGYSSLLSTLKVRPSWKPRADKQARIILKNKKQYQEIASNFHNMPWEFVGITHMMESGCNFKKHLHNGDPLTGRTYQVPKGRPIEGSPPFTFIQSALDALTMKNYGTYDWTPERLCYELERYNGFGYAYRGRVSPYLWSGSTHYTSGKFVADGVYDKSAISGQVGALVLLESIKELDEKEKVLNVVKVSRRLSFFATFKKFLASLGAVSYLTVENFNEVRTFVTDNIGLIVLAVGITLWIGFKYVDFLSLREIKEGRYTPQKLKEEQKDVA